MFASFLLRQSKILFLFDGYIAVYKTPLMYCDVVLRGESSASSYKKYLSCHGLTFIFSL